MSAVCVCVLVCLCLCKYVGLYICVFQPLLLKNVTSELLSTLTPLEATCYLCKCSAVSLCFQVGGGCLKHQPQVKVGSLIQYRLLYDMINININPALKILLNQKYLRIIRV